MVSGPALVVAAALVGVNTLVAALMTRLFRVRLDTAWGAGVFVAMFCPVATTLVTILVGSVAPPVGSRTDVVVWFILVPVALGATVDVFWMPAPEEVELPANLED